MQIKNVKVFTEEKQFQEGEIAIADGVFAREADGDAMRFLEWSMFIFMAV